MNSIWLPVMGLMLVLFVLNAGLAEDEMPAVGVRFVAAEQRLEINQRTLELMIVGSPTSDGTVRARFELQLKDEIARWNAACQLTATQKRKLELAGRGDMKRFFDEFEALILEAGRRTKNGLVDHATYLEFTQAIQPMRVAYRKGLFGDTSLLRKTVRSVLDAEQQQRLTQHLHRQRVDLFETQLDTVLASLNRTLTFHKDQEVAFRKLIHEQIPPPKAISPYCHYYVLYQLAKLPKDKVRPIFNDEQWLKLSGQLQNVGQYEAVIKRYGMLPDIKQVEVAE